VIKADLEPATRRIYRYLAGFSAAGAAAAGWYGGWPWVWGFLAGAAFSAMNFWFWHRLVNRVGRGTEADERRGSGPVVLFALRYGLFAGALYVILEYSEASLSAALAGIFVAVAAVLLEILFELFYGT
jgi:hypothetical protein